MLMSWFISLTLAASTPITLLIKAPQANPHDFFVHAQNSGAAKISAALSTCSKKNRLHQSLKKAQYQFLDGSLTSAQNEFLDITTIKWDCDWSEEERKIITFAFFRLAQLAKNESEKMNHLSEAINFDESIKPDRTIFPPPLIDLYQKVAKQMETVQVQLPEQSNKFSSLLRNGKFISLNSLTVSMHSMRARFTFVSETYYPESIITTAPELAARALEPRSLVDGSCDNFSVPQDIKALGQYQIFFSPDCIKTASAGPTQLASLSPVSDPLTASMPLAPRKKSWIERNLVWVGVAVVSSIAVSQMIKNNQKDTTVVRPTNTLSE